MKNADRHKGGDSLGATASLMLKCGFLGISSAVFSSCVLSFVLPLFPQFSGEYTDTMDSLVRGGALMLLYVIVLAPLIEEALFRYLIYGLVKKFANEWTAIVIQAVLFGLYHGNIIQIAYAFLLGLLLGWIRKETDGLICCIAFHVLFNITGIIIDNLGKTEQASFILVLFTAASFTVSAVTVFLIKRHRSRYAGQTD